MHTLPESADILYATDQQLDPETATGQVGLDAVVAPVGVDTREITATLAESAADALLVGSGIEQETVTDILRTVTVSEPGTAIVVFVDDAMFAEQILDLGPFEVVAGTVSTTPPAIVEKRIEDARDASFTRGGSVAEPAAGGPGERRPEERDLVEGILETSPVGIVAIDPRGTVTRANEQAAEILGLPTAEIEGTRYIPDEIGIYGPGGEKLDADSYPVRVVLEEGRPITDEQLVVEQPGGDRRTIAVDGEPLVENGEIQRAVLAFEDVTASVERERRLAEQRNELAKLDHLNRIIRGVDQALLGATDREGILTAVCEQLLESDRYRFAVALTPVADGRFEPNTWAGPAEAFVDATFPTESRTAKSCPGLRAVEAGEAQAIQDIADPDEFESAAWHEKALETGVRSMVAVPVAYDGQLYGIVTVYAPFADTVTERELDVLDELGETVGYAIAAIERREREQNLTSLYETTQDLLAAESNSEITDTVVDVASEVLDAAGVGICLFDDAENTLEVVSATDALIEFYGGVTRFGPGEEDSATWHAYATGETAFYPDVRESDHVVNPETDGRSTLFVPMGEHGVFVVSSERRGDFGEKRRRLIGLLAATTEAALDRVAGRADLRRRDRKLAEYTDHIDRLEALLSVLRGVDRLLGTADTRAEIETGVCEQLLEDDRHAFAWIGRLTPGQERVTPEAWAGTGEEYLDRVTFEGTSSEPAARAAQTGESVSVSDVTDHLQETEWARHAANCDFQSVVAVPLVYAGTVYGVLGVYATDYGAFDERARSVLAEVGETVAYAINAVETSQGVLAEQLTELELSIDRPETFLNAVARRAGEPVVYRSLTPRPGGSTRVLFSLSSVSAEEILPLEAEFVAVESLSVVESGDEPLFRATLSGRTVAATVLDCGGIPAEVVATETETTAVVRLAREVDVRVFLDRVNEQFPGTELVSRRTVERPPTAQTELAGLIEDNLTERQREVLVTAYESGFFESPRETTGEQLAALLDLSQPTVTYHLREAQRRLFETLLDR